MADKQLGLVLEAYGSDLVLKEVDIPVPAEGEVLIKVEGTTINPSDRAFLTGHYMKKPLPVVGGFEGCGKVVKSNGAAGEALVGKRVSFLSSSGAWTSYTTAVVRNVFVIEEDVPLSSAASGVVNPLTVVGMISHFKHCGATKGIIHTAAASQLGRMLNKACQRYKVPLLNIVRRAEQAETLRSEGAEHVIVTEGEWVPKYQQFIKDFGFDCLYDCLGGGPVASQIISNITPGAKMHVYGMLEPQPLTITNTTIFFAGTQLTGFHMMKWFATVKEE